MTDKGAENAGTSKQAALYRMPITAVIALGVLLGSAFLSWILQSEAVGAEPQAGDARQEVQRLEAQICLRNGGNAIQHKRDVQDGVLWYAQALQKIGDASPDLRASARSLIGGWTRSLPRRSLFHGDGVYGLAFSPDGRTLATSSGSFRRPRRGEVRLWDVATGQMRGEPLKHEGFVYAIAFSPDGRTLATGSGDFDLPLGQLRLYDVQTGHLRGKPIDHPDAVAVVQFSSDGSRLATTCFSEQTLWLWDPQTGQPEGEPLQPGHWISAASLSPDGRAVAIGDSDTVRLWDVTTREVQGKPIKHGNRTEFHEITAVVFSPDGKLLATVSGFKEDGEARLWDAATGRPKGEPLPDSVLRDTIAFSPDSRVFATAGWKSARLWDTAKGRPRGEPLEHEGEVLTLAFSPDSRILATGGEDFIEDRGEARLWNTERGQPLCPPLKHNGPVHAVSISPDGLSLATASHGGTARLWETSATRSRGELDHEGPIRAFSYSPDGLTIVTAGDQDGNLGEARLWDANSGRLRCEPLKHDDRVDAISFSPDSRTLATGSADNTTRLWDTTTGEPRTQPFKHESSFCSVAFSPDVGKVATAIRKELQVWDTGSGQPLREPLEHDATVFSLLFAPDGPTLAVTTSDTLHLWNLTTGKPRHELIEQEMSVDAICFSRDGRMLATAGTRDYIRGEVRLWDTTTGRLCGEPLVYDHQFFWKVDAMSFSPDGGMLAIVTVDTVRPRVQLHLWDVRKSRTHCEPFKYDWQIDAIAFSPDGRTLAASIGEVLLWDVLTAQPRGEIATGGDMMSFSPDGRTLAVVDSPTARLWEVMPPAIDDPDRVQLSVELRVGRTIENGIVRPLTRSEWMEKTKQLDALGGDCLSRSWDDLSDEERAELRTPGAYDESPAPAP